MAQPPTTSTTLLRNLAQDSQHARWGEFVARYRPMMEAFLREHFPSVEADDVIQETLIAVCAALPSYRYAPDEKGHFHNYLTGILRNKALRALRKREQDEALHADYAVEGGNLRRSGTLAASGRAAAPRPPSGIMADDEQSWREALLEIALQQLLNDESIQSRTRQVFLRVAVNGDSPNDVAAAFGIERNAVDQIKNRMMSRLRELVASLEKAGKI